VVLRFLRLALIFVFPLTIGLAPVGASASQPSATLHIHQTATLTAIGSALLTVDYSCNPDVFGSSGVLQTDIQQPGAEGTSPVVNATCDDSNHTITLDNVPGPFTPGSASARAIVESTAMGSSSGIVSAEVNIK
jgi:hypothetical protein